MPPITKIYRINAPVEKVWQALTDSKIVEQWSGVPAKMNDKVGTKFELWGGDIFGENIEIISNKKLVQDWSYQGWDKPSKVTFDLSEKTGATTVAFIHENVPEKRIKSIADGWDEYYLGPLKNLVEGS